MLLLLAVSLSAQDAFRPLNVYHGEIPDGDRTLYIAPEGDNANSGTEETPWATLDFAVSQAEPGDVLVMRGGVYDHVTTISITRHGSEENPIVVTAYPGEVPVLGPGPRAGTLRTGWLGRSGDRGG